MCSTNSLSIETVEQSFFKKRSRLHLLNKCLFTIQNTEFSKIAVVSTKRQALHLKISHILKQLHVLFKNNCIDKDLYFQFRPGSIQRIVLEKVSADLLEKC